MKVVGVVKVCLVAAMLSFKVLYGFVDLANHATNHKGFSFGRFGILQFGHCDLARVATGGGYGQPPIHLGNVGWWYGEEGCLTGKIIFPKAVFAPKEPSHHVSFAIMQNGGQWLVWFFLVVVVVVVVGKGTNGFLVLVH